MSWHKVKVGDFLIRVKELIPIEKDREYNLVTIKLYHKGVQLRKRELGSNISADKMSSVKSGQFILSGIDARNGAFGIIPPELDGAVVTNDFWHFDIDERIVSKEYFLWLTSTPFFDDICNKASDGTTNRIRLQADRFYSQELFIPDIENQHQVVEELKKQGNKIDLLNKEYSYQLTLLENLNQAILQEAVQGKLVPQDPNDEPASELLKRIKLNRVGFQPDPNENNIGLKPTKSAMNRTGFKPRPIKELPPIKPEEIPFDIPENWVWCRLGEIADNVEYGTSQKAEMTSEHIPVLRMNNIQSGKLDYSNLKYVSETIDDLPRLYLKDGDLLFNRTNSYELVGKTAVYRGSNQSMTFASYIIRVQFDDKIISEFISNYINSPICRETQLEPEIIQQNGQANFNGTKLKNILIPLPPLSEQKRIVAEIEKQFAKTKQLKELVLANQVATEQLLKALLHQAFEIKENDLPKA